MRKLFLPVLFFLLAAGCSQKVKNTEPVHIIPAPVSLTAGDYDFQIKDDVVIHAATEDEKNVAGFVAEFLKTKNIEATVRDAQQKTGVITFATVNDHALGDEGYKISSDDKGVRVEASSGRGLFYGAQTLIQLVSPDGTSIRAVQISDQPRFRYRGIHLDVGRHMFPVDFIKKYIDLMAKYKYNTFHWHLTEDQGWRIEIKKYPKLTEVGGYRKETVVGHARTATRGQGSYDGKRYGGFYTQDEVRDIVAYAAQRYVTVVPEIELPGHAQAALTAYPHLGCTGGPYEVATTWGVFDEVFCAGKETTFKFLEDVFDEVLTLFPSEYIHIGGDECPKTRWEKCPHCQKRIRDEKLKDTHELQSYFIQRIEKYLNSKGRRIIGWDEILEGGLAPNATVMSWRGEEGGIEAAGQNHDVIMTPGNWCYFDHYQVDPKVYDEPLAIGGLTPVREVYEYEPIPSQLSPEQAKHILGAQCNVWTEYIPTSDHAEYMVYPRAIAMAEVLWSPKEARNYDDFIIRMKVHRPFMDLWNINYAKHIFEEVKSDSIK